MLKKEEKRNEVPKMWADGWDDQIILS